MVKSALKQVRSLISVLISKFVSVLTKFSKSISILKLRAESIRQLKVFKFGVIIVTLILIISLLISFIDWYVVAKVDGAIISRFSLWRKMEKSYGLQTIEDMMNSEILEAALEDVNVDSATKKEAFKKLDEQLKSNSSVASSAKKRGLTIADLRKQIEIDLKIEELLKHRAEPTEAEVENEYSANKDSVYLDKELPEVRDEIVSKLRDKKLAVEFSKWFEDIRSKVKVVNYGL